MDCRYCNIFEGKELHRKADMLLYDSPNFAVFPTIGPLVEGWVLIAPKEHTPSMRSYYSNEDFRRLVNLTRDRLYRKYKKPIIIFEHGANKFGSPTSCGTDHAHLHMLPFHGSLLNDMCQEFTVQECRATDLKELVKSEEYLYYCDLSDEDFDQANGYIHILPSSISKYFRKLLATKLEIFEQHDYLEFPNLEVAQKTYDGLLPLFREV